MKVEIKISEYSIFFLIDEPHSRGLAILMEEFEDNKVMDYEDALSYKMRKLCQRLKLKYDTYE